MAESSLFRQALGTDLNALPESIRAVHDSVETVLMAGRAEIESRPGFLAWVICAVLGLPKPGTGVVVTVEFLPQGSAQIWRRRFGNRRYQSTITLAMPPKQGQIVEHFGPLDLSFVLRAEPQKLVMDLRECWFLGLRLPKFLSPRCVAEERVENDRFVFDIPIELPLLGKLIHYKGWMVPVDGMAQSNLHLTLELPCLAKPIC